MQDKELKPAFVLLSVPVEVMEEANIRESDLLQFTAEDGKIVIEAVVDVSGFVCGGDCDNCPISETDCDGNCENCPCGEECDEREAL